MTTLSVGLKTGELVTGVVTEAEEVREALLPEPDTLTRTPDEAFVVTGSSLGLAAWLVVTTLCVAFKTGELVTEVVDSREVVTEVICGALLSEVDTSSTPSDDGMAVFTDLSWELVTPP